MQAAVFICEVSSRDVYLDVYFSRPSRGLLRSANSVNIRLARVTCGAVLLVVLVACAFPFAIRIIPRIARGHTSRAGG